MDWDRLIANAARGTDFTGRTARDEQAYYEAFAGEEWGRHPGRAFAAIGTACASVIGFLSAGFMLR